MLFIHPPYIRPPVMCPQICNSISISNISPHIYVPLLPKYGSTWINFGKNTQVKIIFTSSICLLQYLYKNHVHIIYIHRVSVYHHIASTFPLVEQDFWVLICKLTILTSQLLNCKYDHL